MTNGADPQDDLKIRNGLFARLARRFGRRVVIDGNVRSGTIRYIDGPLKIGFWYEMLGGEALVGIDVPSAEQWETQTGAPLARRDEIVEFVASEVVRQKTSGGRWTRDERGVTIWGA